MSILGEITKDPEDNYKEHLAGFHQKFTENCSECYKENRLIQARKIMIGRNDNYPPGFNIKLLD